LLVSAAALVVSFVGCSLVVVVDAVVVSAFGSLDDMGGDGGGDGGVVGDDIDVRLRNPG